MPKIWVEDQNKIQKQEKQQIQNISMDYKISKCLGGQWVTPPNAKSKLKNIQNISMDYKIPKYLGGQWITPQMPKANRLQNLCNNKLHKGIKNYTTPSVPKYKSF